MWAISWVDSSCQSLQWTLSQEWYFILVVPDHAETQFWGLLLPWLRWFPGCPPSLWSFPRCIFGNSSKSTFQFSVCGRPKCLFSATFFLLWFIYKIIHHHLLRTKKSIFLYLSCVQKRAFAKIYTVDNLTLC